MCRLKGVCKPIMTSRGQTMAEYALILATIALVASALYQNASTILDSLVYHVCTLF
jgi:Flp pilus assembly pilin Flp